MPTPPELKAPFLPDSFYHMVCKSIDGILLFNEANDFKIYRERFFEFTHSFIETWSYSLLGNHSHHVVKTKTTEQIVDIFTFKQPDKVTLATCAFLKNPIDERLFGAMIERQMNSFLVSYANYYNNKYMRKGGLFQKPFKRLLISDDFHLEQAIIYTHANAQKHGLIKDYRTHKQSSYRGILSGDNVFLAAGAVLKFFGSRDEFEIKHLNQVEHYYTHSWPSSKLD